MNPFQPIGILGDGVTGKAVRATALQLGMTIVPVSDAEIVIASPGIPPSQFPTIDAPIISELDYAYLLCKQYIPDIPIIAVTGTNGKSTVTSLIAHLLGCPAVGNIGVPFVSIPFTNFSDSFICVEASSYQLETSYYFQPDIALVLNIVEDHLTRHQTMANYCHQKQRLIHLMTADQTVFYNASDPNVRALLPHTNAHCIPLLSPSELTRPLPEIWQWGHYPMNAIAAMMVAQHYHLTDDEIDDQLASFSFLPHRLEVVSGSGDRHFINDSKATNPHATLTAVGSFDAPIHLILCGEDKQCDLDSFVSELSTKVASITVFGALTSVMMPLLTPLSISTKAATSLSHAVQLAYEASDPGDIILFSPSSASYDQFNGFEDRGNQFKHHVQSQVCYHR